VLGFALPSFVIGLAALYVFVLQLRIGLPVGGWVSPTEDLVGNLKALLLPAATIGITLAASTMRLTRTAVLEVIGEDYVRTARAKGLHPRAVLFRHVLRNALSPVVTILGLQAGILVSGLLVTEQVFSLPGLGRFLVNATQGRDVPEIMGVSMVIVIGIAAINVIVDMAYVWLDPRVQVS
jgi:peptide/nickel transport system permease protein